LLPFTSESGKAVCCEVIFQGKHTEVPATWRTGVDFCITPILTEDGKEIDVGLNFGDGKITPVGLHAYTMAKLLIASPKPLRVVESQAIFWWTSSHTLIRLISFPVLRKDPSHFSL
jgi:hypothetical protein